jgi:hypothetical protein
MMTCQAIGACDSMPRTDRRAEHQQTAGHAAEQHGGQHQGDDPLADELAVHRHVVGDVEPGLQGGHAA